MYKKAASGILLLLLVVSMLASAFNIQLGIAEPEIWTVDDDGPADFSSIQDAVISPLVADGDGIYVHNGTYCENVVVNKTLTLVGETKEAIIEGNLTGPVVLVGADNVTLTGFSIRNSGSGSFDAGIKLSYAKNCRIDGNNITANDCGITLEHSSNNTISENTMVNRHHGILLTQSSSNNITRNTVTSNMILGMWGIDLDGYSDRNSISANSITKGWQGLSLSGSCNNVTGNNIAYNQYGAIIGGSNNNIFGNNVTYNKYGFYLSGSENTLRNNSMSNNQYNFGSYGYELTHFMNDLDTSNTVDGKPIYHWVNKHNLTVPSDAGYVALINCTNIAATNLDLQKNAQGILLAYTTNLTITANTIADNENGIHIWRSSGINITENTIANNSGGISLGYSSNISIASNSLTNNNMGGIEAYRSSNNSITENDVANSAFLHLRYSSDNHITGNNITNGAGISIEESSNSNNVTGNNITDGYGGILLYDSSGNIFRDNRMSGNRFNFGAVTYAFYLDDPDDFINDVDASNTVDGKPIYYWTNTHNETVPSDAGYVGLINCTNITVKNLELKNNWEGILIAYTSNTTITQNNLTANYDGIYLSHSPNNVFSGNRIANWNSGIHLGTSSNNKFYHNFIANPIQVFFFDDSINIWDDGYPSGGNYWSDYSGNDWKRGPNQDVIGSDDIGDTPYVISGNNQDNYPLMNPWIGRSVYVTQFNLHEVNSSNSALHETILVSNGTIQDAAISGDLSGFINFSSLHGFKIETGPFTNQGVIRSNWTMTVEGQVFEGIWESFQFFDASNGAFMLKGAFSGDLEGIAEGSIVESVPGSGVYDRIHAVWRRNRVESCPTCMQSAIIELNGNITYEDSSTFSSTELYVYQAIMSGGADGYYSGPLTATVTHVRIEDGNNPFSGEGFSTISYDSQMGSGEGWTSDKCTSPSTIESTGMFLSPLSGVVSAALNESVTPTTLNGTVSRLAIDIGLSLQPELEVRVWGSLRVSPGQTVEYAVEYGNVGLKAAEDVVVVVQLPYDVDYVSSTNNGIYYPEEHQTFWKLGTIEALTRGHLTVKVRYHWGLGEGTTHDIYAFIGASNPSRGDTLSDIQKYLAYEPVKIVSIEILPTDDVASALAIELADQNVSDLYDYSKELGYNYTKTVIRFTLSSNLSITKIMMMNTACNACVHNPSVFVTNINDEVYFLQQHLNDTIVFFDRDGGMSFNFINDSYTGWGTWDVPGSQKYWECVRCGFLKNGLSIAIGTATTAVLAACMTGNVAMPICIGFLLGPYIFNVVKDCFVLCGYTLATEGKVAPSCTNCLSIAVTSIPHAGTIVSVLRILVECIDESAHICSCSPPCGPCTDGSNGKCVDGECRCPPTHTSHIAVAGDPNIKYGPEGYVLAGQTLNYTVEYENEGEGIAFGVYFTDTLDESLNASALKIGPVFSTKDGSVIADPGTYNPSTRTITWFVGEVGSGEGGYANISAEVKKDVPEYVEIINYATVYFPSVPETTRTNAVVSVVGQPNIVVENVTASESIIERASTAYVDVMVTNEGSYPEAFNVTLFVNTTAVQTRNITLPGRSSNIITFIWNTTGFAKGNYTLSAYAWPVLGEVETEDNLYVNGIVQIMVLDDVPPTTDLIVGEPRHVIDHTICLTSATPITLIAEDDPGGSSVASTAYRIYNATYDGGWTTYAQPFYLTGLSEATYWLDYNSTDKAGNIEQSHTARVVLDNIGPLVAIVKPPAGLALQDEVAFEASAIDAGSGVCSVNFSIRETNGGEGKSVGFDNLPATYNVATHKWTLFFDTLQLPDGYYIVLVKANDNLGHTGSTIVPYSIRNWAILELLPATEDNKAGRTMPVKFTLRVAAAVDPNQPFVYNEELTIRICETGDPTQILQESTFGNTARDYRINTTTERYITNFKTSKEQMQYTISIYRGPFFIDSFYFQTVK